MTTTAETLARLDEIQTRLDEIQARLLGASVVRERLGSAILEHEPTPAALANIRSLLRQHEKLGLSEDMSALVTACRELAADREALVTVLRAIPHASGSVVVTFAEAAIGNLSKPEQWAAWQRARPLLEYKP